MSRVLIFAGANGAGKTTFAKSILEPNLVFINADDIQRQERLADIEAGQKALKLIDDSISKKINFAFETTLAGIGLKKRFEHLKRRRYFVEIYYLFVYPVELLLERIKERLKKGGHPVPEVDVKRRYGRSLKNFWETYRLYADVWKIINNNEVEARTIAIGRKEYFLMLDEPEFRIFKEKVKNG